MNRDVVELITALTLIGACAGFAISTAAPPRQKSEPGEGGLEIEARRRRDHQAVAEAPSAQGVLSAPAAPFEAAVAAVAVADRTRPRIFTGEPAPPEAGRPATRRALKLVGGLTALAAIGAVALLALVRAMLVMLQKIGG